MQSVAVGWQVYDLRKNPMDLGWVGLAQFLPMAVFSLIGGQLADRRERKKIMIWIYLLWALTTLVMAYLTWVGQVHLISFIVLLFTQGLLRAFSNPASHAFVTQVVNSHQLKQAVALNSSVWQVSTILGPVVGGFLYAYAGSADLVYLVCTVGAIIGVTLLSFVKADPTERTKDPISWESLFSGVHYVWKKRIILGAISMDLFAMLFGGAVALLPAYAADILHVGPTGLGFLRAAPGLGAILMSLCLAVRPIKKRAGFWLFFNVILFGVATVGFGLSKVFWFSLLCLFITGASDIVSVVIRMTLVQVETPPTMRVRVSAVNSIFISASNELGEFESGMTAAWFGIVPAVVLCGFGSIAVALIWAYAFRELRDMDTFGDQA